MQQKALCPFGISVKQSVSYNTTFPFNFAETLISYSDALWLAVTGLCPVIESRFKLLFLV